MGTQLARNLIEDAYRSVLERAAVAGIGGAELRRTGAHVIVDGHHIPLGLTGEQLLTWEHRLGLNLHDGGYGGYKRLAFDYVVLHWGGLDPQHCRRALANKGYSSHLGIGRVNKQTVRAYQWLDLQPAAYHAGRVANQRSVGIDICQSVEVKYLAKTKARGNSVYVTDNETGRGDDRIVTLDPQVAALTRDVVFALLPVLDLPAHAPRGIDGMALEGDIFHGVLPPEALINSMFRGVIGHHHIRLTKWDIACLWAQIFEGTALG